jgi:hypothetical protein
MLTFIGFNLLEGGLWILCSLASFFGHRFTKSLPPKFWSGLSANFLLFGISDFVEAYYIVTFLEKGGEWLFAWKIICIIGFLACFFWYLKIRILE